MSVTLVSLITKGQHLCAFCFGSRCLAHAKKTGQVLPCPVNRFRLRWGFRARNQLNLQVTPCHTKRAEGRAEQHYCGAAVRNTGRGLVKEDPAGKTIPKRAKGRNRDYPS